MTTISVTDARAKLYKLVDQAREQETLHLLSIPGMRESIREGMAEPIDECSEEPGW